MNVPGVGGGPAGTEFPSRQHASAGPTGREIIPLTGLAQSGDAIAAILRSASEMGLVKLLELIERPPTPENTARLADLLRASVSAAAEGNAQAALAGLAEYAALDPRRAEILETEPGLASIHAEVRQLLFRLASSARMDAESRLEQATHLLQTAGSKEFPGQEVKSENAMLLAGRLLEAGGYANCTRSAELSQMTINLYGSAPTPAPVSFADMGSTAIRSTPDSIGPRNKLRPRIRKLWLRAPLLVLLLAWLAVGLVGGSVSALLRTCWPQAWPESLAADFFEVWGVGFLALVLFGFYARVRDLLR